VSVVFWGEAVTTVVYLLNWVPTKAVDGVTPYELGTIAGLMSITCALSGAWHSSRRQGRI
jgi:hypothetical protein